MSLLACLPLPSRAGQWAVTYSGSTSGTGPAYATYNFTNNQVTGPPPFNMVPPNNFTLGSGLSLSATAPGTATLKVTATLTWAPSYSGDTSLPPSSVGVIETSSASASIYWVNPTGVIQTADDGFKDNPTYQTVPMYGASSSGSHYTTVPVPAGAKSVTLPNMRTLTATLNCASSQGGNGSGGITLTYAALPINIILTGPIQDSSGSLHIQIGQQCSAALPTPSGYMPSNLQWTATGNTVQSSSWNVASGDTSATFSGLVNPYTFTQATSQAAGPSWYWDDSTTSQTVTCTATVTPPSGQGASFPITITQKVTLDSPTFTNSEPVGVVVLNDHYYLHDGSPGHPLALVLAAGGGGGSAPVAEQANGITFNDTVLTPSLYSGTGSWYHLQLISVSRYETPVGGGTIGAEGNAVSGALDYGPSTTFVYDQTLPANGSDTDPDDDNPALGVSDSYVEFDVKNENFQDYIMYTPPNPSGGNSIAVPLAYFTWKWAADVTIPSTPLPKSWNNWNDRATNGTITGPSANSASRQLAYPTWTALRNLAWATK